MSNELKDIVLDEVSVVDKGANPGAHIVLMKADYDSKSFAELLNDSKKPESGLCVDEGYVSVIALDLLVTSKGTYAEIALAPEMIGRYESYLEDIQKKGRVGVGDSVKVDLVNARIATYRKLLGHLYSTLHEKLKHQY